jgi:ABC-type antimicrobial peptide transport system permease subunit
MTVANVAMVIMSALGYMKFVKQSVTAEYAVLGATESCYQKVCSSELVRDCYKLYMQNATVEGRNSFMLIGVSDMAAISDDIRPQGAPSGNLAAVSQGIAHEYSLEVGDTLSFEVSNQAVTLVVGEILDVGAGCVLLDNESLGLHYNMLAVNGKDGVSEAELFNELSQKTSTELAAMMSMEEVWEQKMEHLNVYLVSGAFLLIIVLVFALIGIINNLGQSYRARRDDFRLYRLSGMSAAGVRRMKCAEILLTIGFSLVLAAAGSALFLATTNYAMRANAYEIIMHIESFFRFS